MRLKKLILLSYFTNEIKNKKNIITDNNIYYFKCINLFFYFNFKNFKFLLIKLKKKNIKYNPI